MSPSRWTDEEFDVRLGRLLQVGVIASALLVAAGGIVYLASTGLASPDFAAFHGEPDRLRYVRGIVHAALTGSGRGVIQLGLLVLIATPVVRVAFALFAFARQRDWIYVAITSTVLALLAAGMTGLI
ncbi:MAG: hypothetical protein MNPFHGCM_00487 [Gemmatimonadaceae bacterium]|nr:hypothetical protein [Gemmatimonadaceae bacterium]